MAGVNVTAFQSACFELEEQLTGIDDKAERRQYIQDHVKKLTKGKYTVCPDFKQGLEWFNVPSPLSLYGNLKGKLVVLDFFTYCCINCIHILPDLHALEQQFTVTDGVVVVGVHSAKFDNEKTSANILSAVLRYNITHPVVNDADASLWHQLSIQCWPTLLVLGPEGQLLYTFVGEGHREKLLEFVSVALDYFKSRGQISDASVEMKLYKDSIPPSPLLFPGKVCVVEESLVISDSGHHRILVTDRQGVVQECIGSGKAGLRDGHFTEAMFSSPQGVAALGNVIFVADTENHSVRKICLDSKQVETVCGTGKQGHDHEGGQQGTDQEISSPWDLVLGKSVGSSDPNVLFIAMAGIHQIWMYFLEDGKWLKGSQYSKGTCVRFAGSGKEENRNNSYPARACFAQPSGLALDSTKNMLYVADSESSTVRMISLQDGSVKALVGGERDPMNLFAYGDVDGKGVDAKLQHPLGVAMFGEDQVAVADSYNHKVKLINPSTKTSTTILGQGEPGNRCGSATDAAFNEPGGLALDPTGQYLYIADTNNHSIKVYDLSTKEVAEFPVIFPTLTELDCTDSLPQPVFKRLTPARAELVTLEQLNLLEGQLLLCHLNIQLPEHWHLTEGAPSAWQIWLEDDVTECESPAKGSLTDLVHQPWLEFRGRRTGKTDIKLECMLYYCDDIGTCRMKGLVFVQPVVIFKRDAHPSTESVQSDFTYLLQ